MTSRRKFLATSMAMAGFSRFGLMNSLSAATTTDYKALVCIFMFGGNDGKLHKEVWTQPLAVVSHLSVDSDYSRCHT